MTGVEGELATFVARLDERLGSIETKLDKIGEDHEDRLRRLERWMYAIPASVVTAVISIVVALMNARAR